jgi:hypothetical protein
MPWHLFYTDEGWVEAGDLEEGDNLLSLGGIYGEVESIFIEERTQTMYDLTVEQVHTFTVGEGEWVVHNACMTLGTNNIDFRRPASGDGMRTKIDDDTATVRVGRWMDQDEYDKMVATGRVQAGSQGDATAAMLDGPAGFQDQANSGTFYLEFDIPANSPWW